MPDITLCTNSTCELRDNCKRALIYNDNKPNQSYKHFDYVKLITDHLLDKKEDFIYCDFQLKIEKLTKHKK